MRWSSCPAGVELGLSVYGSLQVFDCSLPVSHRRFCHAAPVVGLFEHGFVHVDQGGVRQVDHILIAPRMIVGGVGAILVPQQPPGTLLEGQAGIEAEGSIICLGSRGVILKIDQVCAAVEPGEELFPPGQAARLRQCQFGSILEILLGVTLRTEDRMDFRRALGGKTTT